MKPVMLLIFTFFCYAINAQDVYVNNFKYKYHSKDCNQVNSTYFPVDIKEAIKNGYKPCKECNPSATLTSNNQDLSINVNNPIEFSKVIYTDSVGKDIVFVAINNCFATNYGSSNAVIQMLDKEAGVIVGKGAMIYKGATLNSMCYNGFLRYTIRVTAKDNRYKVEIFNIIHESDNAIVLLNGVSCSMGLLTNSELSSYDGIGKKYYNHTWNDAKEKIAAHSEYIFSTFELYTKNLSVKNIKDDW